MNGIINLMKSDIGKIILSIIWGLGLSTIFKKACEGKSCNVITYMAPKSADVQSSYYNYGTQECYKYDAVITKC
jgi:hypothetical protein